MCCTGSPVTQYIWTRLLILSLAVCLCNSGVGGEDNTDWRWIRGCYFLLRLKQDAWHGPFLSENMNARYQGYSSSNNGTGLTGREQTWPMRQRQRPGKNMTWPNAVLGFSLHETLILTRSFYKHSFTGIVFRLSLSPWALDNSFCFSHICFPVQHLSSSCGCVFFVTRCFWCL